MKKFGVKLLSVVVTSSMIVTPVMAAPSVKDLKQNKRETDFCIHKSTVSEFKCTVRIRL